MENINTVLAYNIANNRKRFGLTQESLAEKLGISSQAVSKWETEKATPDIAFLPVIADLFEISIDALFSRNYSEYKTVITNELPWEDDGVIRGVVYDGRRIVQESELKEKFTFVVEGNTKSVASECNISVDGFVTGGCTAGGDLVVGKGISGGCCAEGDIVVGTEICGGCIAGRDIVSGGKIFGDVSAKGDITADTIEAGKIEGNVVCSIVKCDAIEGNVTISSQK